MGIAGDCVETARIDEIDRIIVDIAIEVTVVTPEADGVFRGPTADARIVVPGAEPQQARLTIIQAARKTERNEDRARLVRDIAELVVLHPRRDGTAGRLHQHAAA